MTAYELFKAGVLSVSCVCLCFVSVTTYHLIEHLDNTTLVHVDQTVQKTYRTLDAVDTTVYAFKGVGPQAVDTLKTLQDTTKSVGKQATTSLKVVGKVGDGVTQTLDNINRPCGVTLSHDGAESSHTPFKPCGTLADFNRTLATVRGLAGQIEIAARHEDRNLDMLDVQEKQLYTDVHTTTVNLNALVASPDVFRFLKASAETSIQVAAIATDVHKEADKITAPVPWWHKIGTYTTTGVNVACLVTHSCPF